LAVVDHRTILQVASSGKNDLVTGFHTICYKVIVGCFAETVIGLLATLLLSPTANTNTLSCTSKVASIGTTSALLNNCGMRTLPVLPVRSIPPG
jgi:hypothetical protein